MMLDLVRTNLHRALASSVGDGFAPVRLQRDLARRVNMALGEPICSRDELERRRAAAKRLEELRGAKTSTPFAKAQPPVVIYRERDRNVRALRRIKELLDAKGVVYTELDIADDESSVDFVLREAKCERDALPVVFVATTAVGTYERLVEQDVAGHLDELLAGA
ncbi:MAG: hypothetical protein KC657_36985 [Myxococcales bacterium]|nr:hypothetical protein [Myxococcales bacterium]